MTNNLILTKLYIPRPRANLVPRPQLLERLDEGQRGKLTLLSAPPGFGKSTLLGDWARRGDYWVAWLSLDERDNDLTRFLTYLIAALQTVYEDVGTIAREILEAQGQTAYESILTALINEVVEAPGGRGRALVLILDDYQLITARPVHEAVTFLLDFLPPRMHLIIASRTDPELSLGRLRISGQLAELRATDLRFTLAEIAVFFQEVMGQRLAAADIASLLTRTEGWVAGLQVAALSMKGRDDVSSFIQTFSGDNRYILEYLIEEVLERQPQSVQRFLIQTAVLDRLSGPLCDAVVGAGEQGVGGKEQVAGGKEHVAGGKERGGSQVVLERLQTADLFIARLDDERRWYRYHPLFAEFLRAHLRATQPELAPLLHRRAARWLEQNGQPAEAVGHALAAGDHAQAVRLVELSAREAVTQGEWRTLQHWLDALPKDQLRARPRLALAQAWAHLYSSPPAVTESWLQTVEKHLPPAAKAGEGNIDEWQAALHGEIGVIRATMASAAGDTRQTIQLGRQALAQLPQDDRFLRTTVITAMGYAYRYSGDVAAAQDTFEQVVDLGQQSGNRYQILDGLCNVANQQLLQGRRREAMETAGRALQITESSRGKPSVMAVEVYLINGVLLYEKNELEAAGRLVDRSLVLSERAGLSELRYAACFWSGLVACGLGDRARAMEHMEAAGRAAEKMGNRRAVRHVAAGQTRLFLFWGDLAPVTRWVAEMEAALEDRSPALAPIREFEDLTLVEAYLALGRTKDALILLAQLGPAAEAAGRFDHVYRIRALLALTLTARGDTTGALDTLARLLPLTMAEGYVRLYVDLGRPMAALLRQAAAAGVEAAEARKVLGAFAARHEPDEPTPVPVRLTRREKEVLALIVAGYSNQQIASELVITLGTAKRHISNIYRKLGVRSRTQAVAKAREMVDG